MFVQDEDRSLADRRRDATREGILDAAWEICRRDGLGALSLRDLGRSVGLKASSLYAYFDSKSAIYDAMFLQGYLQLDERSADWEPSVTGEHPRAAFKRATQDFFEFCTSDPVRYQLMFQRVLPDFEPTPETYEVAVRQLERLGGALAAMGVTDPAAIDLWTAILTGLTDQQISNDPGGDRWQRLLDTAVDLFCDHAGIPREGATP
jgi:AcrR family transcriptional regulator